MYILTEKNSPYNMNDVPNENADIRFCILDYTNYDNLDFFFIPLIFLESYYEGAVELQINNIKIVVPLDWHIVTIDKEISELEIMTIENCMDKDFSAFVMNPLSSFKYETATIDVLSIYPNVKWFVPKLKYGHILVVPIENKPNPQCILMVKDTNKLPDKLDLAAIL